MLEIINDGLRQTQDEGLVSFSSLRDDENISACRERYSEDDLEFTDVVKDLQQRGKL